MRSIIFFLFPLLIYSQMIFSDSDSQRKRISKKILFIEHAPFNCITLTLTRSGKGYIIFSNLNVEAMNDEQRAENQASFLRVNEFLEMNGSINNQDNRSSLVSTEVDFKQENGSVSDIIFALEEKPSLDFFHSVLFEVFDARGTAHRDCLTKSVDSVFNEVFNEKSSYWALAKKLWNEANEDDPLVEGWGYCPIL